MHFNSIFSHPHSSLFLIPFRLSFLPFPPKWDAIGDHSLLINKQNKMIVFERLHNKFFMISAWLRHFRSSSDHSPKTNSITLLNHKACYHISLEHLILMAGLFCCHESVTGWKRSYSYGLQFTPMSYQSFSRRCGLRFAILGNHKIERVFVNINTKSEFFLYCYLSYFIKSILLLSL